MDKENKTIKPKDFNFMNIRVSLNSSMAKDNIFVSKELKAKTMDSISKEQEGEDASSLSKNTGQWKKDFNFTNVIMVALLFLVIGTGIYNNISKNYSDDRLHIHEKSAHHQGKDQSETNETLGTSQSEVGNPRPSNSESLEEDRGQDIKYAEGDPASLAIPKIINLESSDIDNIEISYYVDKSVRNKDLTSKKDRIFDLFRMYSIEEVAVSYEDGWTNKLRLLSNNDIYTILIGNRVNVIKTKQSDITDHNTNKGPQDIRTFSMDNVDGFIYQLDQIINGE